VVGEGAAKPPCFRFTVVGCQPAPGNALRPEVRWLPTTENRQRRRRSRRL